MKAKITAAALALAALSGAGAADAKGCLVGAAAGGVAGHFAGHHPIIGAVAGCAIGHHMAAVKARRERATAVQGPQPAGR